MASIADMATKYYVDLMNRGRKYFLSMAWIVIGAWALTYLAAPAHAKRFDTEKAACAQAKVRVAWQRHVNVSVFAYCDLIVPKERPRGFYVLALHVKRYDCGDKICGSTLAGWFAVERSTGKVFEWDVAEWKLSQSLSKRS